MRSWLRAIAPLFFELIFMVANGQSSGTKHPDFSMRLHPGDALPDVSFDNVKNWGGKPLRLTDFKGKLLILDFWTVNCSPCIAAMPKMEELQRKFDGSVQVVMVTPNSKAAVEKLTGRSKILQKNTLPSITDDTLLGRFFPYTGTPTHVWIGKDGKLMFVTNGYNTNAETVQNYLDGMKLSIVHEESQPGVETDVTAEFGNSEKSDLRFYSLITGRSRQTTQSFSGALFDTANNIIGYRAVNTDVYGLLRDPFLTNENFDNGLYLPNRTIWRVKDNYPYISPNNKNSLGKWQEQYLYCYELKLPYVTQIETIHDYLATDVKRFFGLSAHLENHKTKCLVLVRTSSADKIRTKGGKRIFYTQEDYSAFEGQNIRMLDFLIIAFGEANYNKPLPVVDGTNYLGNIDLSINADLHDLQAVRKELRKYDLDLVEEERTIPMIVISEKE